MKRSTRFLVLLSTLLCFGTTAAASAATVQTNRLDYYPGENVVISGSGWQPGEVVNLLLQETPPLDPDLTLYAQADAEGNFVNAEFYTDIHDIGVAFTLTATGVNSLLAAQTTFTDSGANLDQWANDAPAEWVNGNLGASKSTYYEGNSIPYRLTFGGLTLAPATHTVIIEWDTTKGGKHALDYLTSYIQPDPGFPGTPPNPCTGVADCNLGVYTTYPIPTDPLAIAQIPGVFTLYGGTITAVSSSYTVSGSYTGDSSTRIAITFTASVSDPVLAWGGHIATRKDWGLNDSAVAISGSPYHTRLISLDGTGGNQDRSLSADAVIFPGQIKIIKSADPEGSTVFTFTGSSAPLASFTLTDDGITANNTKVFPITDFKTYTVTETVPSDWKLNSITCTVDQDPMTGSTTSVSGATATLNLKEGAFATCTFFNVGTRLTVNKICVPETDAGKFNLLIDGVAKKTDAACGSGTGGVLVTAGLHTVSETGGTDTTLSNYTQVIGGDCAADGTITLAAGDSKTCTITNTRDTGSLKISKVFDPLASGFTGNFTIHYACDATHTGNVSIAAGGSQTISGIPTGTLCTVSEPALPTAPTGWTFGTPTLSPADGKVTITTKATEYTVTVTNTISRDTGTLTIAKTLSNPDGTTVPASFTVNYNCGTGYTGSRSVAPGSNATVTGIPTGNTCTITEAALAPITGYTWGTPTYTPPSIIISDKTGTFTLTVANSITRDKGTLTIAKSLSNPDGATVPASFTVNYNCGNGFTGSVSVAAGGSATVPNIPTGNTCTITEAALAPITGYTWGTPTYSPASIVIADKTGTFTLNVANSITRDKGTLTIAKSLSNPDGASVPASFSVNYNCGAGYEGMVSVAPGSSATVSGIPTGNTCTIAEVGLAPIPGYTWGYPTYSPASVIISDKTGTFTLTVANSITRDKGTLTIAKTLSNPEGAVVPSFEIHYTCGNGFEGSVSVAAGGSATVPNIPTGSTCTVSEPVLTPISGYTWGTPTYTPALIVISDKVGTFTITVGNSITRDKGTLTIAKTLSNPDGAVVPAFEILYSCGNGFTGSVAVAAGGSATVPNIPTGSTCTVSEPVLTPISGYTWGTPTFTPASVIISDKIGTFTITVANSITRDLGTLTIAKSLSNPEGANVPASFLINYDCGAGHTGNRSVPPGGNATVTGIPTGNTCTITEAALSPIPGYTWGTPTYSPASIVIADKVGTFTLTVGNSITRDRGTLTIAKSLSNPDGANVPASFLINYDCGTGYTGSRSVAPGGIETVAGIPTGNTCTITEAALSPIGGYTWGAPTYSPASIVISNETGTFTLTAANSITRDRGALQITKTVLPSTFSGSFSVHVACTGDGGAYDATISYPSPGLVTISNIPTGNTCTVTETSKAAPLAGYTWLPETITGSPATIVKGGTATVTVANKLTGLAKVVKTVTGALPTGSQAFTFQIRQGASTIGNGTTIASGVANASNNGEITFSADLTPGATYQICEIVMPAWTTTLGDFVPDSFNPPDGTVPNPNVDNSILCGSFTVNAGETKVFAVDNTPPPGGRGLTIGFWKNWASCADSKGGQEAVLDATLLLFPIASGQTEHGVYVGKLYVDTCAEAVAILDKRTLAGKKVASDPLFNMAAQLMAAELNLAAGAYRCPRVVTALETANALLTKYNFAGNPYTPKLKAADAAAANNLAKYLDDYNNNRTGVCP